VIGCVSDGCGRRSDGCVRNGWVSDGCGRRSDGCGRRSDGLVEDAFLIIWNLKENS